MTIFKMLVGMNVNETWEFRVEADSEEEAELKYWDEQYIEGTKIDSDIDKEEIREVVAE